MNNGPWEDYQADSKLDGPWNDYSQSSVATPKQTWAGKASEFLGKSVIEPVMGAVGLKEYADVPATAIRTFTAPLNIIGAGLDPEKYLEKSAVPISTGHQVAKEIAALTGMAAPYALGYGVASKAIKGAGIAREALRQAGAMATYGQLSHTPEGEGTRLEQLERDVLTGAAFGAAGGVAQKAAARFIPSVGSALTKEAMRATPEIVSPLPFTPGERIAKGVLPYMTSGTLMAGAGAAEPADTLEERARRAGLGFLVGAGAHGVSEGIGAFKRGVIPETTKPTDLMAGKSDMPIEAESKIEGLRPIMKTKETGELVVGEPGQTHQDMIDAGLASKGDREGFITPERIPLNLSEAMKWAVENHKGIETYLNPNEAGNLHTENYNQAFEKWKAEQGKAETAEPTAESMATPIMTPEGVPLNRSEAMKWAIDNHEGIAAYLTPNEAGNLHAENYNQAFEKWKAESVKGLPESVVSKQEPTGEELMRKYQQDATEKFWNDEFAKRDIKEAEQEAFKQSPLGAELLQKQLREQQLIAIPQRAATDIVSPIEEIPSTGISAVPKNLITPEVNVKAAPEVKSEPLSIDNLVDVGKEGAASTEEKVALLRRTGQGEAADKLEGIVDMTRKRKPTELGKGTFGAWINTVGGFNVGNRRGELKMAMETNPALKFVNKKGEFSEDQLAQMGYDAGWLKDNDVNTFWEALNNPQHKSILQQESSMEKEMSKMQREQDSKTKIAQKLIEEFYNPERKIFTEDEVNAVYEGLHGQKSKEDIVKRINELGKTVEGVDNTWFTPPQQKNIKETPTTADMLGAKGFDISGGKLPEGVPVGETQLGRAVRENNEAKLLAEQNKKQGNLPIDKQAANLPIQSAGGKEGGLKDELSHTIIEGDTKDIEALRRAYGEGTGKLIDKAFFKEANVSMQSNEGKDKNVTLSSGLAGAYEEIAKIIKSGEIQKAYGHIVDVAKNFYEHGKTTFKQFNDNMKEFLGDAYGHVRDLVTRAYTEVKNAAIRLVKEETGAIKNPFADVMSEYAGRQNKNLDLGEEQVKFSLPFKEGRAKEESPISIEKMGSKEDTFAYVKKVEEIYKEVKKEADIFTDKSILMKRDIKPAIKAASNGLSGAWDGLKKVVYPMGTTEGARTAGEILIEEMGHGFQSYEKTKGALNEISKKYSKSTDLAAKFMDYIQTSTGVLSDKLFNKMSKADQNEFIYNIQKDLSQKTPELRDTAKVLSSMFEDLWKEADKTIPGLIKHRKDFFVGMWEDPESAQRFFEGRAKSAEGSKSYTKPKLFSDIYEGIEAGQTPKGSPLDMAFSYMHNIRKLLSTHKALQAIEKEGGAVLVPSGSKTPYGFTLIPEPYGVITKRMGEGEMGEPLETSYRYAVKEDVAQVFNNYLSSNLYNSPYAGDAYKAYMGAGNTLNQFQLGVGAAFHAGFESMETIVNHQALAWKAFARRDYKQAAKLYLESPLMIARSPMRGDKVIKALHGDSAALAEMPNIIEWVTMAGGRVAVDNRLRTHATDSMLKQWSEGNKMGAVLRSPIAIVEQLARPIMEYLVPRQKMGVFYEKAKDWVDRHPNATHEEMRKAMQSAWSMVDMTMGQVVYERMFMHNIAKNVVQGLLRAPGWTGGTALVLGGAAKDMVKIFKDMSMGKRVEMTDKLAYTTSLLVTTAIANGVMTTLMTGEQPKKEDLMAFRTGRMDNRGLPERFLLPTYAKDLYAYMNSPKTTLLNKTHPLISLMSDIAKNKDYYGTEIRSKDSNIPTQAGEVGTYVAKAFVPFWMRGVGEAQERGKSIAGAIAPLVGIMPASTEYTKTDATRLLAEYSKEHQPAMSRTKEEFERVRLKQSLKRDIRAGGSIKPVGDAIHDGRLTSVEGRNIIKNAHLTPFQEGVKSSALRPDEALKVWNKATDDEKVEIRKYMLKKMHSIKNMLPEQRTDMLAKYREVRDWKPE